jgi:hypothetical protein
MADALMELASMGTYNSSLDASFFRAFNQIYRGFHPNLSVTIYTRLLYSSNRESIQLLLFGAIFCPVRPIANDSTVVVPIGLLFSSIVFTLEIRFSLGQGLLPITLRLLAFVLGLRLSLFPIFSV